VDQNINNLPAAGSALQSQISLRIRIPSGEFRNSISCVARNKAVVDYGPAAEGIHIFCNVALETIWYAQGYFVIILHCI
jgi:hypothetical protein